MEVTPDGGSVAVDTIVNSVINLITTAYEVFVPQEDRGVASILCIGGRRKLPVFISFVWRNVYMPRRRHTAQW